MYFFSNSTAFQPAARLRQCASLLLLGLALGACSDDSDDNSNEPGLIQPKAAAPAYAPDFDPQMLAVIEKFVSFDTPMLSTLSPRQARMTPSVTDAVKTLLAENNREAASAAVTVTQRLIPGTYTMPLGAAPDGLLLRIYTPTGVTGPLPVVVYYHGGGWVIGSLDVYGPSAKKLAEKSKAIVVSVDYRLADDTLPLPLSNNFPAAHEDAFVAYKWVRENAGSFGGNPAKVAVAGESAGGNMAVGVCLLAKQRGLTLPTHQLLIYPVADNNLNTASYVQYANAQPLNRPNIEYFTGQYFTSPADGDNQLISLVDVADLAGLPTATIIAAQIDPLQTEGKSLSDKFTRLGVSNEYRLYQGTTHEFFGTHDVVPKASQAQDFAAERLRAAFQ